MKSISDLVFALQKQGISFIWKKKVHVSKANKMRGVLSTGSMTSRILCYTERSNQADF